MTEKTARLRELREQLRRKTDLETRCRELTKQQRALEEATAQLEQEMLREQEDISDLQRKSLKSMLYGLTGKKEQKLEQERKEAAAARMKYEAALREQKDTEYRLTDMNRELAELEDCAAEYLALLKELMMTINNEEATKEMDQLIDHLLIIGETKKEISHTLEQMEEIRTELMEADRWATALQFGGREAEERFMFDALDNARRKMGHLLVQIRQLQTRFSVLNMEAEIVYHANILPGFQNRMLSAAAAKQMVKHAHGQNYATKAALQVSLEQLESIQKKTERQLEDCCENLIKLAEKY